MSGNQRISDVPHVRDVGFYLAFARGISEIEFIRRVGADPDPAKR